MKLNRVAHARKDQGECSRCHTPIKQKDPYVWWSYFRGPKKIRCTKSECQPRPSELASNEVIAAALALGEEFIEVPETYDEFRELATSYEDRIREEVVQVAQDKMDTLSEAWPNAYESMSAYEINQTFVDEGESWADEVGRVPDDFDEEDFDGEAARDALQDILNSCPL